ncbi:MAG TPA: RagB/SusD family nutrient uptake outer membrane protein [Prolixibacteraceae bacterium]|nr:RagB/SusD family nutrient uptake outer membrane protein [Prolixibacteraceae bacterium]
MKRTLIISTLIGLICTIALTGCEDFLSAENKSAISADAQFSTKENYVTLLNQAYYKLRDVYNEQGIFMSGTDTYAAIRDAGDATLETYAITADNGTVKSFYSNLYSAVNAANAVLYYADLCEDFDEKALNIEEARFIRAFSYFILTQQFGSVPLIKSYINTAETSYPRTDLEEVYTFLIDELTELSTSTVLQPIDKTGHASVQAAKALLAKVYLAAGWDLNTSLNNAENGTFTINGTSYFEKAAQTAAEICDAMPLTLSFEEKWSANNEQNEENIFAIQYDRGSSLDPNTGGHSQQNIVGTYLGAVTLGMKYVRSDFNVSNKTFHLFNSDDERYNATFMTTVYNYAETWGTQGYWAYYNASESELSQMPIAFYFPAWYVTNDEIDAYQNANAQRLASNGYSSVAKIIRTSDPVRWIEYNKDGGVTTDEEYEYYGALTKVGTIPPVKKFDDPATDLSASTGNGSFRDIVVINLSEIYLVAAEAYLMAGNEQLALKYLNSVRKRAKTTELSSFSQYQRFDPEEGGYVSADQSIDVVLDERARELLGEYYRWMDLRRTRQLVKYNLRWNTKVNSAADMTGGDGNIKWYRPIPADEIGLNTGMEPSDQNPGYSAE